MKVTSKLNIREAEEDETTRMMTKLGEVAGA